MLARLLLLGAAAASANALHSHQASSTGQRASLNYGPATPRKITVDANTDLSLAAFNAQWSLAFVSSGGDAGIRGGATVAADLVRSLHPLQSFRLQSASESARGTVYHAYFVQTVDGLDVVDSLLNVNVDTLTGAVLGYGDSVFSPKGACDIQGALSGHQLVFGTSATKVDVLQQNGCTLSALEVVDTHEETIDPRLAISSFLHQADPALLAVFDLLDTFVSGISVSNFLANDHSGRGVTLHNVPGAVKDVPARLAYVQREDGTLALTWSFEYESNQNWYEAHVSAGQNAHDSATPLLVVDWVRDAPVVHRPQKGEPETPKLDYSYRVFPWSVNDPSEGRRETVPHPANMEASLSGWHEVPVGAGRDSGKKGSGHLVSGYKKDDTHLYEPGWSSGLRNGALFKDTRGNNVFASANPSGGTAFELNQRPKHNETGAFDNKLGYRKKEKAHEPLDPTTYLGASITELFYTINEIHDLLWHYGFDEVSGNFQEHNLGRGGLGGDAVVAFAQDGSGMNNANFATPPDGNRPRMRMYKWSGTPETDGDLEAGIVIHEFAHGVSTRLTGGPANSNCLPWSESGGMGEGYGDFIATIVRMQDSKVHDFTMGEWAAHRAGAGIRPHPYSTNMTTNPDTYKTLDRSGYWGVHAIGSVYAEFLFEVAEALIAKHGWTKSLFPPAADSAEYDSFYAVSEKTGRRFPKHGNTYVLQLLLDSFKLQPCRPSFMDNRDSILKADEIYTGGENACTIWKAYAKRGLGPDASLRGSTPWGGGIRTDDFSLPKKCIGKV